jgi:hypothetical protein
MAEGEEKKMVLLWCIIRERGGWGRVNLSVMNVTTARL